MEEWFSRIPSIDWLFAAAVALAIAFALSAGRRGGRYRELPGWALSWIVLGLLLVALSRAERWISFPLLGLLTFAALRAYYFVAPVRPRDRYAILATYLAIPLSLWPAYTGSYLTFSATVPVSLFLFVPVFLAFGSSQEGFLDSVGRTLLGVLFFVFSIAHLGLLVHQDYPGLLEFFGILVLGSELPQRLLGRFRPDSGWLNPVLGIGTSAILAMGLGFWLGPWCGLVEEDGMRAGLLVVIAVTLGARVSRAVAEDLALTAPSARLGRGAFLNRLVPAVYAAPVFFHYLNHFA
jgi:predicted CDP-diglyceride synthetase/phosphatidate cytidylyltransferase